MSYFDFYTREFVSSVRKDGVPAAPKKAYVINTTAATVSVIDTSTEMVVATISVTSSPEHLIITPDNSKVYVLSQNAVIDVIDTSTDTVSTTISVGAIPNQFTITPDGAKLYVTDFLTDDITVISTSSDTVIKTITGTLNSFPEAIVATPDGSKVYYGAGAIPEVGVITTSTDVLTTTISLAAGFRTFSSVGMAPDGARVYFPDNGSSSLFVIDTATDTETVGTPLTLTTSSIIHTAILPDSSKVYVGDGDGAAPNVLSVINNSVSPPVTLTPISGFIIPGPFAVTPDGARVYASDQTRVRVVTSSTDTLLTSITVSGASFRGIASTSDGKKIYAVNNIVAGDVSIIDNTVTPPVILGSPISVGARPTEIVIQA